MMTLLEKATILHYHKHRVETYDAGSVGALGFRAENSQQLRFAALCQVANLSNSRILDVGCGYGDLKAYLDEHYYGLSYIGIDQMAEFVTQARQVYGQRPSCYFCVADFTTAVLPQVDYVFASGVLNYRCANPDFYCSMIEKMYRSADKALAFNMLDTNKFPAHDLLMGHQPEQIVNYCQSLATEVKLLRGYLDDDFSVLMYR